MASETPSMKTELDKVVYHLCSLTPAVEAACYVGAVYVDIAIRTAGGTWIAVVARSWQGHLSPRQIEYGARLAQLYRVSTGFDDAFMLLPFCSQDHSEEKLFTVPGLLARITDYAAKEPFSHRLGTAKHIVGAKRTEGRPIIFVAMPFAEQFEDTFFLGIAYAAEQVGALCVREDCEAFDNEITERVRQDIARANLVVADLSGGNANVAYELGFADAMSKPALLIAAGKVEKLPFNVRGRRILPYRHGKIHEFRDDLIAAMRSLLTMPKTSE